MIALRIRSAHTPTWSTLRLLTGRIRPSPRASPRESGRVSEVEKKSISIISTTTAPSPRACPQPPCGSEYAALQPGREPVSQPPRRDQPPAARRPPATSLAGSAHPAPADSSTRRRCRPRWRRRVPPREPGSPGISTPASKGGCHGYLPARHAWQRHSCYTRPAGHQHRDPSSTRDHSRSTCVELHATVGDTVRNAERGVRLSGSPQSLLPDSLVQEFEPSGRETAHDAKWC